MDTRNNTTDDDPPVETAADTLLAGEALLDRARAVGERITKRCRQVAGEKGADDPADRKD